MHNNPNNNAPRSLVSKSPRPNPEVAEPRIYQEQILLGLSFCSYCYSMFLPAAAIPGAGVGDALPGFFLMALIGFPPWWANPLLLAAWVYSCYDRPKAMFVCSSAATALALAVMVLPEMFMPKLSLKAGYYAWLIAHVLTLLASLNVETKLKTLVCREPTN